MTRRRLNIDELTTLRELLDDAPGEYGTNVTYAEHNYAFPECDRDDLHEHRDGDGTPVVNVWRFDPDREAAR